MKYRESVEQSAERMRLAIPLMARQAAGVHPVSYAVWYEYVAGTNPPLKAEIDEMVRGGARLTEEATWDLYVRHIGAAEARAAHRVTAETDRILAHVSESAADAGSQATRFGASLEHLGSGLAGRGAVDSLEAEVAGVLRDTRAMQDAVSTLSARLEESRREADQLRAEVFRAREEALTDSLTGLANRRAFDAALEICLSGLQPGAQGPCLLIVDVDHFKRVNDTYGHLLGDRVLRALGQLLKATVKGQDTAARCGGEEFAVLLPETPIEGGRVVAEKIRTTVAASRIRRLDSDEVIEKITVSVGVASWRAVESAGALVGRADEAMYRSKSGGRNRVTVADAQ